MADDGGFGPSEWISLGALVVAAGSWFDSRRRIKKAEEKADEAEKKAERAAVRFRVEIDEDWLSPDAYLLRNVGTVTARSVTFDGFSTQGIELERETFSLMLEPEQTMRFGMRSSRPLPDTIKVIWSLPFVGSQNVRVPRASDEQKDSSQ